MFDEAFIILHTINNSPVIVRINEIQSIYQQEHYGKEVTRIQFIRRNNELFVKETVDEITSLLKKVLHVTEA